MNVNISLILCCSILRFLHSNLFVVYIYLYTLCINLNLLNKNDSNTYATQDICL